MSMDAIKSVRCGFVWTATTRFNSSEGVAVSQFLVIGTYGDGGGVRAVIDVDAVVLLPLVFAGSDEELLFRRHRSGRAVEVYCRGRAAERSFHGRAGRPMNHHLIAFIDTLLCGSIWENNSNLF